MEGTFGSGRYIYGIDCGGSFTDVEISQFVYIK